MNEVDLSGAALNRAVAELLGWHIEISETSKGNACARVISPDGQRKMRYCVLFDTDYVDAAWTNVPQFSSNLNDAFNLTVEGWKLTVEQWCNSEAPDTWLATYYNNPLAKGCGAWGETPAEAICRARLELNKFIQV